MPGAAGAAERRHRSQPSYGAHHFAEIANGLGKPSPAAARMAQNRAVARLGTFMRAES